MQIDNRLVLAQQEVGDLKEALLPVVSKKRIDQIPLISKKKLTTQQVFGY
jgi:hypothetical protein